MKNDIAHFTRRGDDGIELVFADDDEIAQYDDLAAQFLSAVFGIESYLVSDLTTIDDFRGATIPGHNSGSWDQAVRERVFAQFGIECTGCERLVEVLHRIDSVSKPVRVTVQ